MSPRRHNEGFPHHIVQEKIPGPLGGSLLQFVTSYGVLSSYQLGELMDQKAVSELHGRLAATIETLRKAEECAIAGRLALELMHEIKNPLEALGYLIYLAAEQADYPDQVKICMSLAREQMVTLANISSQTLGIARTSHLPKPINLVTVVEAALRIHQRTIESRKVHLVKDLPEDVVAAVYTGEILQVLSNLIVNALDSLDADGTLFLRLRKRRDEVRLVVADNGHGIPPQYKDEIFKPFFTTKKDRGNGLGLALSKKIVERHRGTISLRSSVRPGKSGTTFRICLPA
jgi:signal transduction histidine kinase